MTTESSKQLADLLNEALSYVEIQRGRRSRVMSLQTYRRKSILSRRIYDFNLRLEVSSCQPTIANDITHGKLLEFLRVQLTRYIREDRIQSAAGEITFGYGDGFPIQMVLDKILDVAIVYGINEAVQGFEELLKNEQGEYQSLVLLNGVRIDDEAEIYEGVRIKPLPSSEQHLLKEMSGLAEISDMFLSAKDVTSKSLVIVDWFVSPLLADPDAYRWRGQEDPTFQHVEAYDSAIEFDVETFCHAMSLACNAPIQPLVWWRQIDDNHIFNVTRSSTGGAAKSIQADRISTLVPATRTEIGEAKRFYEKLLGFDTRQLKSLNIALNRWIKSKARGVVEDRMIDLGIAFESLLLRDSTTEKGEVTLRFCLRGAHLCCENVEGRKSMYREFKSIYNARSRAVHTGELPNELKVHGRVVSHNEFVNHAQDLCLLVLKKIIDKGRFPDWHQMVLS